MTGTKERIKSVLLVVLIIGAVFMAYSTWFYDSPMGEGALGTLLGNDPQMSGSDYVASVEDMQELRPISITVRNGAGRVCARHSAAKVDAMYAATRAIVAEAMSTPEGEWKLADEKLWHESLLSMSVLYDYQGVVRLASLSHWLGAVLAEKSQISCRYVLLNVRDGVTKLLVKNPYKQEIYVCAAKTDAETVSTLLAAVSGDACRIAAELADIDYAKLVPETIVGAQEKPQVIGSFNSAAYFTQEQKDEFLKSFGLTPYSVSEYSESDGTKVFIEEMTTVRLSPDGFAVYTDNQSGETQNGIFVQSASQTPAADEIFETALTCVSRLAKLVGGESRLYSRDFYYQKSDGCWVAEFGLSVNGVPVDRGETGYCARVIIKDMRVTELSFYMRSFRSTGRGWDVLPQKLAAAAVDTDEGTCELELRYTDAGQSEITPGWYRKN